MTAIADQAAALRGFIEKKQSADSANPPPARTAYRVAVTSGKGGVGKSNIALNLAAALAAREQATCLLDANPGWGNIDLLCGLNGFWNLSHVGTGARTLNDIMLDGPEGLHVIPAGSGPAGTTGDGLRWDDTMARQMDGISSTHDVLVVDAGMHPWNRRLMASSDLVLVITTPEPTAIADAYATIKSLVSDSPRIELIVNFATSPRQAASVAGRIQQTSRFFLKHDLELAGSVPQDPQIPAAVLAQSPFLTSFPQCPASRAMVELANHVTNLSNSKLARLKS